MSESTWGDEPVEQKVTARGGVPVWVWGCGGGCFVLLLLGVVGGFVLFSKASKHIQEAMDPEVQWRRVAEVMPFEERPAELEVMGMPFVGLAPGMKWIIVLSGDEAQATLLAFEGDTEDIDAMFAPGMNGAGMQGREDAELGTIEIQGRETRALRFYQKSGAEMFGASGQVGSGPSILLDLTGDGPDPLLVQMTSPGGTRGEPIPDALVRDFLAPFDAWGTRIPESEKERPLRTPDATLGGPDVQWARIARVMPYDERPEGFTVVALPASPGTDPAEWTLLLRDASGRAALLFAAADERALDELFEPPFRGLGGWKEPRAGTIEIQGRETRAVRFHGAGIDETGGAPPIDTDSAERHPGIVVDLSQDAELVALALVDREAEAADEPIADDVVRAFLEPFDVWRTSDVEADER